MQVVRQEIEVARRTLMHARDSLVSMLDGETAWPALRQLVERERRGERLAEIDQAALRARLEQRLDDRVPGWRLLEGIEAALSALEPGPAGAVEATPAMALQPLKTVGPMLAQPGASAGARPVPPPPPPPLARATVKSAPAIRPPREAAPARSIAGSPRGLETRQPLDDAEVEIVPAAPQSSTKPEPRLSLAERLKAAKGRTAPDVGQPANAGVADFGDAEVEIVTFDDKNTANR